VWGGRRTRTQMVRDRSSTRIWNVRNRRTMRTWRVRGRSTTTASWTMREGRVMGLLQAQHPDAIDLGGAMWSPLL
jgi:hypothetical protein